MHLNPPMVKEAPEEIRNRKTEASKNIRKETNRFVLLLMRNRLLFGSTPMDHAPRLKKMTLHQIQKMRVGALTRLPPLNICFISSGLARLPPSSKSLRSHKIEKIMILLLHHARGLAVASFSRYSEARANEFLRRRSRRRKRAKPRFT